MKTKIILLLALLMPIMAQAQRTQRILPQSNATGKSWVDVAENSSTTFTFTFPGAGLTGSGQENSYSGYLEIIVWADTISAGTIDDGDSLTVSVYPLFYDMVDLRLEQSNDADKDSIDIKNIYDWGSNHSDERYAFNVSANLPPCDGFQLNIYTGFGGKGKFRVEGRIAESARGF